METDVVSKENYIKKGISMLENEIQNQLKNPSLQPQPLVFNKNLKKNDITKINMTNEIQPQIEELEKIFLDLNTEFTNLRKSRLNNDIRNSSICLNKCRLLSQGYCALNDVIILKNKQNIEYLLSQEFYQNVVQPIIIDPFYLGITHYHFYKF